MNDIFKSIEYYDNMSARIEFVNTEDIIISTYIASINMLYDAQLKWEI